MKEFDSSSSGEVVLAMNSSNYPHITLAEDEANDGKIYEIVFFPEDNNEFRLRHGAVNLLTTEFVFHAGPMKEEFRSVRISFDPASVKVEQYHFNGTWELLTEYNREQNFQAINFCKISSFEHDVDWRVKL